MKLIPAKTIVNRAKSSMWFGASYNMNIYKGCCHGCIYCDSRSDCYRINNFDEVCAKENALEIIRNDLRRKIKPGVIATGSMSDPYNPFEKELQLTRNALELINAYQFGVAIATKSDLITRDIDILKDIKLHSPVITKLTITAFDDNLSKKIEPNVCSSKHRFNAIERLSQNGIFSGVLLMPVLPFITDNINNITNIVKMSYDKGAKFIYPAFGVTLRGIQREYFYNKLDTLFENNLKEKYIKNYGDSYNCSSTQAKKLYYEFANQCEKYGIYYKMQSITRHYKQGYGSEQLTFL